MPPRTASSTKLPPMKPAPPVTSHVVMRLLPCRCAVQNGISSSNGTSSKLSRLGGAEAATLRVCRARRAIAATAAAAAVTAATLRTATTAPFGATAEHLHLVGDDVGEVLLHAILAGVLVVTDFTLDVDLRPFFRYSPAISPSLPKKVTRCHCGLFLLVAVLVLAHRRGGEADLGDRHAALGVFHFRVIAQVADQDRLVYAAGHVIPRLLAVRSGRSALNYSRRAAATGL